MNSIALLALCLAGELAAQTVPSADSTLAARIERYLQPFDSAGELSGTVLLARGDRVLFEKSYGMADYRRGLRNTPETVFGVASLTKPLTGLLINQLMDKGMLAASDPIAKWLPAFPRAAEITIAMLRGHRSGIPHRVTTIEQEVRPWTAEQLLPLLASQPLQFEPGAQYLCSSAGYAVLARVLELASGKSYADLLRDLVFAPAGVTRSFDATQPRTTSAVALGYLRAPEGPLDTPPRNLSFLVGAGSVYATARDLFAVVRAINNGTYGSTSRQSIIQNRGVAWNGFSNGNRAFVSYDPATDVTVILVSNLNTGAGDVIRRDLPRLAAGEDVRSVLPPRPTPFTLSEDLRGKYEGTYELGPNQPQQLRFLSPTRAMLGSEYLLLVTGARTFFSPQDYAELTVQLSNDSRVTGLQWKSGSATLEMPRR